MSRILIVDDASSFLLLLSKLLHGKGYEVATAKNGEEALEILQAESFDLMISDLNMQPVDGMELLKRAKASYAKMKVIMLTAYHTIESANEATGYGVFAYITKPLNISVLFETVHRALH